MFDRGEEKRLLKLYRRRSTALRSFLWAVSHRLFEGKRGVSAAARFETERLCLELWRCHGFDVFRTFDEPLPAGAEPPGLWLEYCPAPTLWSVLRGEEASLERKRALLARFAADLGRRHRLACDRDEPLLVHEHGTLKHVLVSGERLISFDLEGGFRAGFPVIEAVAQELAGHLRLFEAFTWIPHDQALGLFVDAFGDRELLRAAAERAVHDRSIARRLKRWQDQRRRPKRSKTAVMRQLLTAVGRPLQTESSCRASDRTGSAEC